MGKVNYIAVIVVVILQQLVGALWYSPLLFKHQWMNLAGTTPEGLSTLGAFPYYVAVVACFFLSFTLARLINATHSTSVAQGMKLAFLLWLGFIFPVILMTNVFLGRPFELTFIDSGHFLVDMLIAGGILAVFR